MIIIWGIFRNKNFGKLKIIKLHSPSINPLINILLFPRDFFIKTNFWQQQKPTNYVFIRTET